MDCIHSSVRVVLPHQVPVVTTVFNVDQTLSVEDGIYTSFMEFLGIFFKLGIVTNVYTGISNFVKRKATDKVGVMHLNMSIHDMNLVNISPKMRVCLAKLAMIALRIQNFKNSGGFSLPNLSIELFILDRVLVVELFWTFFMLKDHLKIPRNNLFSCEPNNRLFCQFHQPRPLHEPVSKLRRSTVDSHVFMLFERVVDLEVDCV